MKTDLFMCDFSESFIQRFVENATLVVSLNFTNIHTQYLIFIYIYIYIYIYIFISATLKKIRAYLKSGNNCRSSRIIGDGKGDLTGRKHVFTDRSISIVAFIGISEMR